MPSTRSVAKGTGEKHAPEATQPDGSGGIRSPAKDQQGTAGLSTTTGVDDRSYSDAARGATPRLNAAEDAHEPAQATTEPAIARSDEIAATMGQMLQLHRDAEKRHADTLQMLAHAIGEFSSRLPDQNGTRDRNFAEPGSETRSRDRRTSERDRSEGSNRTTSGQRPEKVRGQQVPLAEDGAGVRDRPAPGHATAPKSGTRYRDDQGADEPSDVGSEYTDQALTGYVPNASDNPHAKALYTGGDTYFRPQTYDMHGDPTYDILRKKPNGSLCRAYRTVEPSLRYLYNASEHLEHVIDDLKIAGAVAPDVVQSLEALHATVDGVYGLLNRYTATIHLRAKYGENRDDTANAKLQFIEGMLDEEDTLPAGLDDTVRQLGRDFDRQFQRERHLQLAKKAAKTATSGGSGGRGGGDGGGGRGPGGGRGTKGGKGAEGNKSKGKKHTKADSDSE